MREDMSTRETGKRIAQTRKELGWSARKLSERCEQIGYLIPRGTIAKTESGDRTTVPVQELVIIAEALGVLPSYLFPPLARMERDAARKELVEDLVSRLIDVVDSVPKA